MRRMAAAEPAISGSTVRQQVAARHVDGPQLLGTTYFTLVPEARLELARDRSRRILSPLRIPFHHSGVPRISSQERAQATPARSVRSAYICHSFQSANPQPRPTP